LIEAFKNQKPLDAEEIAQELQPVFKDLGEAFRARDRLRMVAQFDLDRLFDELLALEVLPPHVVRDRRSFARGMREGMGPALVKQAPLFNWTSSEIKNVKKLEGNEAAVIVRHRTADGHFIKMRWWLTKRDGT